MKNVSGWHDHASRAPPPTTAALVRMLGVALGDDRRAATVLAHGLTQAGLAEPPEAPRDLLVFVKAHLLGPLSNDVGPRIALAVLEDLAMELGVDAEPDTASELRSHPRVVIAAEPVSSPRRRIPTPAPAPKAKTRPSILLIDANRVARASLARTLVRGGCDVSASESADDVRSALAAPEPFHVAFLDMDHPLLEPIVEILVDAAPLLPIVACTTGSVGTATAFLVACGAAQFDVRLKSAPPEELLDLARKAARGAG